MAEPPYAQVQDRPGRRYTTPSINLKGNSACIINVIAMKNNNIDSQQLAVAGWQQLVCNPQGD